LKIFNHTRFSHAQFIIAMKLRKEAST